MHVQEQLWGSEPVEEEGKGRAAICLNGVWRLLPDGSAGADAVPAYARVPGVLQPETESGGRAGIVERTGWTDGMTEDVRVRYEREVAVPAGWAGRSIVLDLGQPLPGCEIAVNGSVRRELEEGECEADLTGAMTPGEASVLSIRMPAGRGLEGDVLLRSRPQGPRIADVYVLTSVRRMRIGLEIELAEASRPGTAAVTAEIRREDGGLERVFTGEAALAADGEPVLRIGWDWNGARLWDVRQPHLYTLALKIRGCGVDDEYVQVFGFREFWIEGRRFFLNGTEIRLRPVLVSCGRTQESVDGAIDGYLWAGFTIGEIWPSGEDASVHRLLYERADRKGWLLTAPAGHIGEAMKRWDDPLVRQRYREGLKRELRRVRNHPSIVMWGTNGNQFGSGLGLHPRTLGMKRDPWHALSYYRSKRVPAGEEMVTYFREYDPGRPVFTHHGGGVGDVYTLNFYLNFTPLQEREEWLSHWAAHGEMPFLAVEFGTPLHVSFHRGRTDFGEAVPTEPLLTEYCAIYLGKRAYELETCAYREEIRSRFVGGQHYRSWHFAACINEAPAMQELQALFSRNTWRSWRTAGITGGMIPWNDGHGWGRADHSLERVALPPFVPGRRGEYVPSETKERLYGLRPEGRQLLPGGRAIVEGSRATMAWIAGGPEETAAGKRHLFRAGSRLRKQVALLNDTRQLQPYRAEWTIEAGGTVIGVGRTEGCLEVGGTLLLPVECELPAAEAGAIADGLIRLQAEIGGAQHEDRFGFRLFGPEPAGGPDEMIGIFDPQGETAALFASLGYRLVPWPEEGNVRLVIVGRRALEGGAADLLERLERHVEAGGRCLLMAQDPEWVRSRLGFRVAHHVARRAYPVRDGHPALAGLGEEELRDWAGTSALVDGYPYPEADETRFGKWWFPYYGYRWGNRGGVSSCPVEKPHFGSWRAILECEFDLAYTPLMELELGTGKLVWCPLDLEDQAGPDPAAERLARRLPGYALDSPAGGKAGRTGLLGDSRDAALLLAWGVNFEPVTERELETCGLLIVGSRTLPDDSRLEAYLEAGGRILFLPRREAALPLGAALRRDGGFGGTADVPDWPECRGIGVSDLHARAPHAAWLAASGGEIGASGLLMRKTIGSGTALFCQLDPGHLNADEETFLRLTRWRYTRAVCQLLANMGAEFRQDRAIFHPAGEDKLDLSGEWEAHLADRGDPDGIAGTAVRTVRLPCWMEGLGPDFLDFGKDAVFRRTIDIPSEWQGRDLLLFLGKIDDSDETVWNGKPVHDPQASWPRNHPRVYTVPAELVRPGRNELRIRLYERDRLFDKLAGGGIGGPAAQMFVMPKPSPGRSGYYHADYRADYVLGDDPYRYFNW